MATTNKFTRLAAIGAMPEKAPISTQTQENESKEESTTNKSVQESEDILIYRLVAELERDDLDKFLDYKHYLTATYGSCANKDVVHEMLDIVYQHITDINPRPESVRKREQTYSRKAVKRTRR